MSLDIFQFKDYKQFFKAKIKENAKIRGYQTKLSDVAKCHRSFFSQFLSSKQHLSPEQLFRLSEFWGFNGIEKQYLIEMLHLAKADYIPLQNMIKERMENLKRQSENLAKRFSESKQLDPSYALPFYSSWHVGAIHMLTGLDEDFSVEALAKRLQIPTPLILSSLKILETMGLAESKGATWRAKPGHMHIAKDSPLCSINHSNWRQRAVLSSQNPAGDGLHYTCAQSHSNADFQAIKEILLKSIDQTRQVIIPSNNEEATTLCIDFFRM